MTSRKILVQTTKSSNSPKMPDFQNGGKSPCIAGKETLSGLRTRVQKWTYFELLIENRRGIFLKAVGFFVKNRQDMKK